MQKRHKSKTTLITSNLGFSEWGSFLKNTHLTAALVDRLTENSHVINMKKCHTLRGPLREQPPEESRDEDDADDADGKESEEDGQAGDDSSAS
jgi:hypothetical protein